MKELLNHMRLQAQRAQASVISTKLGIVTSYNPSTYAVKVQLQPDGNETGWLPLGSAWVGNGWGMFSPPAPGDQVKVEFVEGSKEGGIASVSLFSDADRPLPCPSGEFWLIHQSGSMLKFHNDGTVALVSAGALTSSAPAWNHTGNLNVIGNVGATGTVSDSVGTLNAVRIAHDTHTGHSSTGGTVPNVLA